MVLGFLATIIIAGIENAVVVGGVAALAAALYSIGVPKDSVLQYESAIKADSFLVMARGTEEEIARAKTILGATNPLRLIFTAIRTPSPLRRPLFLPPLEPLKGNVAVVAKRWARKPTTKKP